MTITNEQEKENQNVVNFLPLGEKEKAVDLLQKHLDNGDIKKILEETEQELNDVTPLPPSFVPHG